MNCPKCGAKNLAIAAKCSCGYDLETKKVDLQEILKDQARALRENRKTDRLGPAVTAESKRDPKLKNTSRRVGVRIGKVFLILSGIVLFVTVAVVGSMYFSGPSADETEYYQTLASEMGETQSQLPSNCERMVLLWQNYIDRFPTSEFADSARGKRDRWNAKLAKEILRGFQMIIEEAEVKPVKGASHGNLAGRPWDLEVLGPSAAPDPYVVVLMNGEIIATSAKIQDSFHPIWQFKTGLLQVSDSEKVSILVRERDVGRAFKSLVSNVVILNGILSLTGATIGLPGSTEVLGGVLSQDEDDEIAEWTGTIRDLMTTSNEPVSLKVGDCENLQVRVIRP